MGRLAAAFALSGVVGASGQNGWWGTVKTQDESNETHFWNRHITRTNYVTSYVATHCDFNGDGFDDYVARVKDIGGSTDKMVMRFGNGRRYDAVDQMPVLDGTNGFEITMASYPTRDFVCFPFDDGDTLPDLIFSDDGAFHVYKGRADGTYPATVDHTTWTAADGFNITNAYRPGHLRRPKEANLKGTAQSGLMFLRDFFDMFGGNSEYETVLIWPRSTTVDLAELTQSDGFNLTAVEADERFGYYEFPDLNGDGVKDLVFSAQSMYAPGTGPDMNGGQGCVFVMWGKANWGLGPTVNIPGDIDADPSLGYYVCGNYFGQYFGAGLYAIGDANLDGIEDIMVRIVNPSAVRGYFIVYGPGNNESYPGVSGVSGIHTTYVADNSKACLLDFNGDGLMDIAMVNDDDRVVVELTYGNGNLSSNFLESPDVIFDGEDTNNYADENCNMGDIDGDGNEDLLAGPDSYSSGSGSALLPKIIYGRCTAATCPTTTTSTMTTTSTTTTTTVTTITVTVTTQTSTTTTTTTATVTTVTTTSTTATTSTSTTTTSTISTTTTTTRTVTTITQTSSTSTTVTNTMTTLTTTTTSTTTTTTTKKVGRREANGGWNMMAPALEVLLVALLAWRM